MTLAQWPSVRLGTLLQRRKNPITVEDNCAYRRITIRLDHQGVELRDEVMGSQIGTKSQFEVHEGQFILSKIDARNGAFGVIPKGCDRGIITGNFWVFDVNTDALEPKFFEYFSRTHVFSEFCVRASSGTTNRRYLQEDRFLNQEVPLPPVAQQQRIVAKLESLGERVDEVKRLQRGVMDGLDELCRSILRTAFDGKTVPMRELVALREPSVEVKADETYHFAGVYCFGGGVFVGQQKTGMEFQYKRLTRLRTDDFVYPKLMAWEGALATVPAECDGLVVSTEFPVFAINKDKVLPEVLDVFFRTPAVWPKLSGASTGTNVRRRRLNPADFLSFEFPLPKMDTQLRLRDAKKRVDAIRAEKESSSLELAALFPSILDRAFRGELT